MPKRKRSFNGRRRFKRRRRFRRRRIPRGIFRKSVIQRHKYISRFTINPDGTGAVSADTYRLNGMYDPTVAAGGHQPMMFDQLSALYNKFTVLGAKATVTFSSTITGATGDAYVLLQVSGNSAVTSDFDDCVEQPHTRFGLLTNHGASARKTLSMKWSRKKWFGRSLQEDQEGSPSGDPTDQVYIHCGGAALANGADPNIINGIITITYIAKWHDPKVILGS